ncbi:hypothetical protein Taro_044188 [Colocasia esculenta]|uniref:Disease resistance RPP13-like protein 1 n=1 Tax=Colocasia esculenta TaxID=4460 RepID=A0A843WL84_COLES|nr:hypothetical protein [Colocasia esculenta]
MAMVLDAFVSFFVERLCVLMEGELKRLLGVEDDLDNLMSNLQLLGAFLRDAERMKITDEAVRLWLSKLREVMYDADDLIDDYMLEADKQRQRQRRKQQQQPSCSLSWFSCIPFRHEIGKRIAEINGKLGEIAQTKPAPLQQEPKGVRHDVDAQPWGSRLDRETSWMINEADVVGFDLESKDMTDRLTRGSSGDQCLIYAIVGMGGIGKTTLAQKVYNDARIESHFEVRIWVCVSHEVNGIDLLKAVIESGSGGDCSTILTKARLETGVAEIVRNKRFLLVLDDVWDGRIWEAYLKWPLQSGAINSRVLITTRNEDVAGRMGRFFSHNMKLLPNDEGWRMLCKAFEGDKLTLARVQMLRPIGMEIVNKCKGLPLAIKAIRGVLIGKDPSEATWRGVLQSQLWNLPEKDLPKEIMPALYLSYEDLPSHLKQCFIYCSLFPEDYKFHKLNLVQMWVAEGFVKPDGGRAIEDIADDYYKELMDRNLLQAVSDYFEDWGCKMHDVVRELALHLSQHKYIYRGAQHADAGAARLRHLTIVGNNASTVPEINNRNECLRTLLLSKNPSIKNVPSDFLDRLRRLRVLDLTYTGIESLTDSVGNLIHLRFMNVSYTKLTGLPESIQHLRNLQTLKANGCKFLHRLPNGVVHLLSLTHLTVGATDTQLEQMPTGIGELRKLHTLYGFVVNEESQGGNNMKELEHLTQLRRLTMHRLEAVAGEAKAEAAVLKNKSNLKYLRLSCTKARGNQLEDPAIQKIEEVFKGLLPPSSLESLHIEGFFGHQFPDWITRAALNELRWLRLEDCKLCKQLPPLGRFHQLRVLHIWSVTSVTTIGPEFFSGRHGTHRAQAFPLLEELYFRGMSNWKRWSGLQDGSFPFLKKLHIVRCPRLRSLPDGLQHATSLKQLVIEGAEKLISVQNLPSIIDLKITNNQNLEVVSNLPELKVMDISNCPSIKETKCLDGLGHLRLSGDKMDTLPIWLAQITSLQRLDLTCGIVLLKRCSTDGKDWPIVHPIPRVEARSNDGSNYISYVKSPLCFESNLAGNGDSPSVSHSPYCT